MKTSLNVSPVWVEKLKDGSESFTDVFARLVKDRVIFLTGEIDQENACIIVALFLLLDKQDSERDIQLWISSDGGDVQAFFAIYDMMQLIKAPVSTVCVGSASSAAALLLAAGTPGKRCSLPNSMIMIHQIQVSELSGTGTEIEIEVKEVKRINARLNEILARHAGQTLSQAKKDCVNDKHMNAEEAKNYGIIDKVMVPTKKIPELKAKK